MPRHQGLEGGLVAVGGISGQELAIASPTAVPSRNRSRRCRKVVPDVMTLAMIRPPPRLHPFSDTTPGHSSPTDSLAGIMRDRTTAASRLSPESLGSHRNRKALRSAAG